MNAFEELAQKWHGCVDAGCETCQLEASRYRAVAEATRAHIEESAKVLGTFCDPEEWSDGCERDIAQRAQDILGRKA